MRAVVQRVSEAAVLVGGDQVAAIGRGLLVLVGVGHDDGDAECVALAAKLAGLRIFADSDGKMNLSVADVGGAVLIVSQFTLLGDARKGRRPSFTGAAAPEMAEPLLERLAEQIAGHGVDCRTGRFGAMMDVRLVNEGPVTIVLEVAGGKVL